MNVHSINWNDLSWKTIREGVEQKAFSGAGATVALHRLQPGHEPRPHKHANEQIAWIVEGECEFHVGDEVVRLGPGGMVVIPPDTMHHAVVTSDVPVVNLDVFTPNRPEYAPHPG